jgi:mono/diheme cytochrome c family protein
MRHFIFGFGLIGLLLSTGCAGLRPAAGPKDAAGWTQGQFYVSRSCAGCHAVTEQGASPDPHAPAFRTLPLRFDRARLESALAAISRNGHQEMPPIYISPKEIGDIARYIESLEPSGDIRAPDSKPARVTAAGPDAAGHPGAWKA